MTAVALAVLALAWHPAPDAPLPSDAAGYARALVRTTSALEREVDAWRKAGGPQPEGVELEALRQQRLYLALGARPALAREVIARLRGPLRAEAADVVRARAALTRLTPPTRRKPSSFRTGPAEPPEVLLRHYREAQRRFGVPWHVLAAVNFVETAFGRVRSQSTAGAQGPMQFLPSTWRLYGLGGNVYRPRDAILGAANYLRASGAPQDLHRALWAYNHSSLYVDAVLAYARRMAADVRAYYGFWSWQVFIRTPSGPVRITGPGRS